MVVFRMSKLWLQRQSKHNPRVSDPIAIRSVIKEDVSMARAILTRHAPNHNIKTVNLLRSLTILTIMKSINRGFKKCSLCRRINKLISIGKYTIKHPSSEEQHRIKGLLLQWNRFKNLHRNLTKALWYILIMKTKIVCLTYWIMHLSKEHCQ